MDFYKLNRKVERILRRGDKTYQETTYEEKVNSFYRKTRKYTHRRSNTILTKENSVTIGEISKNVDTKLIDFKKF